MFALVGVIFVMAASCGGAGTDLTGSPDASTFDDFNPGSFNQPDGTGTNVGSCTPATSCAALGFDCGVNADGCGGTIDCGTCSGNDSCGVGGYSKCGNPLTTIDGGSICPAKTCADYGYDCGPASDGCGKIIDCGSTACPGNETCGGGGSPSKCGGDITKNADGGAKCTPATCASLGFTCGMSGDGCGGTIGPCGTCTNPQYCGGGGPNKCGGSDGQTPDGGSTVKCVPATCATLGATCGVVGDGCGGTTPLCGTCTSPQFCGGGGASKCGGNNGLSSDGGITCTPKTCASYGANACGQQSDGCGGLTVNCGACTNPQFCGGGGAGKCGGNNTIAADGATISNCHPATCASLGYTCGMAGDGCGGTIGPCGPACAAPTVCGGSQPNQCGSNIPCTGLCQKQVKCDGGTTTTLTGTVRAGLQEGATSWVPGGTVPDPVPGVLVYIPTAALSPFDSNPAAPQVQCSQCGADVSGSPLITATTDYNGTFTLTNVPVSASASDKIPIVIQLGKWRRQFAFAVTNSCGANTLPQDLNLPSTSSEGDIPLTAISTGSYDPIECVLLKMGVAQTEFKTLTTWQGEAVAAGSTTPRAGRIHIYTASQSQASGNGSPGATIAGASDETALLATNGTYMMYDQILLPCWGEAITKSASELTNLGAYGDNGGHFFATHYSYSWLNTNANSNLSSIAQWDPKRNVNDTTNGTNGVNFTGNVSTTVPVTVPVTNPGMFAKWLNFTGALANSNPAGGGGATPPAAPRVTITAGRHDVDKVLNQSVDWIDGTDPAPSDGTSTQMLLHFTFDMPIASTAKPAPTQCGHGIYSDFHVVSSAQSNGKTFPAECDTAALSSQERIIEYMIWDLASCVPGPPTATCTPKTCANFPGSCGQQGDTCGGLTANCGSCAPGQTCGGGGVANQCGAPDGGACTALGCASYPTGTCGPQSNGCGGTTPNCSNCPAGEACGGGGTPGVCGAPDGGACTPLTCAAYAGVCGQQTNGCGGLTPDCNPCPTGQTCGGGGTAGVCGSPPGGSCTPLTCAEQSIDCGPAGDGCGNVIQTCGSCPTPQTCGGGGIAGQCGGTNSCTPLTCAQQNIACGPAGDGCGNLVQGGCGTCTPPATCGGGGVSGQCGGTQGCTPKTCQDLDITCGPAGDGCGNLIASCGTCSPPDTCGGGGSPGQCGATIQK